MANEDTARRTMDTLEGSGTVSATGGTIEAFNVNWAENW